MSTELGSAAAVADFGLVYQGKIGYSQCRVSLSIESWQQMFFIRVSVEHQKNRAGRMTRVIKWPYSRIDARQLSAVIDDWRNIELSTPNSEWVDSRNLVIRWIDWLTGCQHLGEYRLKSPLTEGYDGVVRATGSIIGGQREIWLREGRKAGVLIMAQFPHAACEAIRQALSAYSLSKDRRYPEPD